MPVSFLLHGRSLRFAVALFVAAAVPALSMSSACAQAARPRIERESDLPRFTYPVKGKAVDIVTSPEKFAVLSAAVRRNTQSILDGYDIPDHATLRDLMGTLNAIDFLDGRYDDVLARIEQIRALEDKPGDKLTSGLRLQAMARAAKANGGLGGNYAADMAKTFHDELDPLPFLAVQNNIEGAKAGSEFLGEPLVLGRVNQVVQPVVDKTGELASDLANSLINARFTLVALIPVKQPLIDSYSAYLAAHKVQKPDIWGARDVTLTPEQVKAPVVMAVWDSGVDTSLYGPQVLRGKDGKPVLIAYDVRSRRSTGELFPIPASSKPHLPLMLQRSKGFSDIQSNIDSPEASEVKQALAKLSPDEFRSTIEEITMTGQYEHGTHVAGITLAGNPGARLVIGRIDFDYKLQPQVCPSEAQTRLDDAATQAYVDFFKLHHVRVVNMSWGGTLAGIESALEKCNLGKTVDARKALARHYFDDNKRALTKAFASAPEILFVTAAGNSNSDATFSEDLPASIVLPNLLTVGAVDLAGDEAPFTSYGPTVKVDANGYQVVSYLPGGSRVALSGTSMASPQVANLAGKLLAVNPKLTPAQLIELIVKTSTKSDDGRRNLIDPRTAIAGAMAAAP